MQPQCFGARHRKMRWHWLLAGRKTFMTLREGIVWAEVDRPGSHLSTLPYASASGVQRIRKAEIIL